MRNAKYFASQKNYLAIQVVNIVFNFSYISLNTLRHCPQKNRQKIESFTAYTLNKMRSSI